jgi:error-prone DNA polymerase
MQDAHAARIEAARNVPFTIEEFAQRSGLSVPALRQLAEADAFRSLGLDRRKALCEITRFAETGTPAALLVDLPLFAASRTEPLPEEIGDVNLSDMTVGEHVLHDYAILRMSLKAHPVGLLRARFADLGYIPAEKLPSMRTGRHVEVAGIVLVRQRPGSVNGVVFATLEDETSICQHHHLAKDVREVPAHYPWLTTARRQRQATD